MRSTDARWVDREIARLRVLEEGLDDAWRRRARDVDDSLRVVRHERLEDAAVEGPGGLTGLDGRLCCLALDDVDEAVPRQRRREDERLLAHTVETPNEAGVDLQLSASRRVDDADRVSSSTEVQLLSGETVQRRIRNTNVAPLEQLSDLGELDAILQPLLDGVALLIALTPRLAMWPFGDVDPQLTQQPGKPVVVEQTGEAEGLSGGHVAPHRFGVDTDDAGDGLLGHAFTEQPDDFFDLEHRHLAKRHVASGKCQGDGREGGEWW